MDLIYILDIAGTLVFAASGALMGGLVYWGLASQEFAEPVRLIIAAISTSGLRIWAMARGIDLPRARAVEDN